MVYMTEEGLVVALICSNGFKRVIVPYGVLLDLSKIKARQRRQKILEWVKESYPVNGLEATDITNDVMRAIWARGLHRR